VAPSAISNLFVSALELPPAWGAERPGSEHGQLAVEDGEAAATLLPRELRLRGHGLRREAGEPDAAALLRRVAQGEGLLARPFRRER